MIGIIGAGNMGMAIASGMRHRVLVSDIDSSKLRLVKNILISIASNNIELSRRSDIIILAVKPQDIKTVLKEIRPYVKTKLIISIAAGVKTGFIEGFLGKVRVVRVMPNMPAVVGKGISAITGGRFTAKNDFKIATGIFSKLGEVVEVREGMMDAVTAVSGSGPAYYFLFTYLLQKAAEANGLKKDLAEKLAIATFAGAAAIAKSKGLSMEELIKKVASKGGTTEAALTIFGKRKLEAIIKEAVKQAMHRSKQLYTLTMSECKVV